jgi:CheY-like chemotaxis protein
VLLVDDDATVRSMLTFVLRKYLPQAAILTASDGAEALHTFETHPVPVLITDYRMPHLSGLELTHLVKTQRPQTCVIFITGDMLTDIERRAYEYGADYFLGKPFPLSQLQQILDTVLTPLPHERGAACS